MFRLSADATCPMPSDEISNPASRSSIPAADPTEIAAPNRTVIFRALLAAYVLLLGYQALRIHAGASEQVGWALQSSADIILWLRSLAWREISSFGLFFVLGLFVPLALPPAAWSLRKSRWIARARWLALGCCVVLACVWIAWGSFPRLAALAIPLAGYVVGVLLSSAWLRGIRSLAWAIAQLAIVATLLVVTVALIGSNALDDQPLDFPAAHLTDADKHRLAQWIRETRPAEGEPRRLKLTDSEVEAIINAGVGRGLAERKAQVRFDPAGFDTTASLILPQRLAKRKFLNARISGTVGVTEGDLDLNFDRFEVGRVTIPSLVLRLVSPAVRAVLLDDPRVRQIIGAIASLQTEQGAVETVFEPGALGRRVVPSLAQLLWQRPDVAHQTEIYIRVLINRFNELPPDVDRFGILMQTAFGLAQVRSEKNDPALENRAAIFALAILMGHQGLEPFVGEVEDATLRAQAAPLMDATTIRDRRDWVRHFLVSAALVLLSSEATSDRIGLLKEQLDSQDGGSGFSFGDLLADRAGTRFAAAATRDGASAVAMQNRLAGGFNVGEFFPPADDLPEGISDADFQSQYGGVTGRDYRELSDEIDARLARLPLM